jgi:hypothetical protein
MWEDCRICINMYKLLYFYCCAIVGINIRTVEGSFFAGMEIHPKVSIRCRYIFI